MQGVFHHHYIRLYVIFAHSHLYFKKPTPSDSLLLPGTFSCPHSCQHLLQSARQPVSGKKKKRKKKTKNSKQARREQVGLLYKLSTQTFQKFRMPPSLLRSAEQYSGPAPRARRRLRFLLWYGCLDEGQLQRVRLQCMSAGCVGNCSHFM